MKKEERKSEWKFFLFMSVSTLGRSVWVVEWGRIYEALGDFATFSLSRNSADMDGPWPNRRDLHLPFFLFCHFNSIFKHECSISTYHILIKIKITLTLIILLLIYIYINILFGKLLLYVLRRLLGT